MANRISMNFIVDPVLSLRINEPFFYALFVVTDVTEYQAYV